MRVRFGKPIPSYDGIESSLTRSLGITALFCASAARREEHTYRGEQKKCEQPHTVWLQSRETAGVRSSPGAFESAAYSIMGNA